MPARPCHAPAANRAAAIAMRARHCRAWGLNRDASIVAPGRYCRRQAGRQGGGIEVARHAGRAAPNSAPEQLVDSQVDGVP